MRKQIYRIGKILNNRLSVITVFCSLITFFCSQNGSGPDQDITVLDVSVIHQLIKGFGAANIVPWRPDMTAEEITRAFGTDDGQIGFSLLRLRIPYDASEFALNVPTAKAAYDMGVGIIASPWTPPVWMKTEIPDTNNRLAGGYLSDISYAAYADHLKSFSDYMENSGAPLYAISIQNEPDVTVSYESCDWNEDQMVRFLKENAPSIGRKIIAPESATFDRTISDAILDDPLAANNTAIIGGHIYGSDPAPYPLAEAKAKEVWMTEHLELTTGWPGALQTAKEISDCMNAGMSAYIWWYIVRFYGPIYDDDDRRPAGTEKGQISKRGYVMSQFARFIRPGYHRIEAEYNPQDDIYLTVYSNGGKLVIVVINYDRLPVEHKFKIMGMNSKTFTPYITSEIKNCAQQADINTDKNSFEYTFEKFSVTTFVSD